jgi:6-pyruvoyl-tetrahydropterin synthase
MHMRMDLSREEETKKLLSESMGLVSMSAFQKELVERIGCRVQHIKLNDLNNNHSKTYESIKEFLEFMFDNVEQFLPESKTNENEVVTNEYGSSELCLEDRLIKFDQEVIRKECPNTPEEHRLMRPEMLEMLLEFLPTNIVEFGEKIPPYLRIPMQTMHPTNPDSQSKYIKDVVNIIDEFGER